MVKRFLTPRAAGAVAIALSCAIGASAGCRSTADAVAYLEELHTEDGSHAVRVVRKPTVLDSVADIFTTNERRSLEYEDLENPTAECHETIDDVREGSYESNTVAVRAVAVLCRIADRDTSPLGRQMALAALGRLARDVVRLVPATSDPGRVAEPASGHVETIIQSHDIGPPWTHRPEIEGAANACLAATRALTTIRYTSAAEARAVARLLASVAEFDPDPEIAKLASDGAVEVAGLAIWHTIVGALRDESEPVRAEAARVAGSLREPSFVAPLAARLTGDEERSSVVRRIIARSFGVIGDKRAVKSLVAALKENDDDESLDLQIRLSLAELSGRSFPSAAAWREWWRKDGEEFERDLESRP